MQQRLFSCAERALAAEGVAIHGHPAINDGDHTDLDRYVMKGEKTYKLQFKYTDGADSLLSLQCFTKTSSKHTKSGAAKLSPYKQGVNNYYVFSVGTVTHTMLFLPESVLIHEGVIKTNSQPGETKLTAHSPYTAFQYHHGTSLAREHCHCVSALLVASPPPSGTTFVTCSYF